MNINRKTAIIVGILFIIGTAAGISSVVFTTPVFEASNILQEVAANKTRMLLAILSVLTMGLSLAMVPVVMFPILKKHNERLAMGYVVFRSGLETVTYFFTVASWFLLIALSQAYVNQGAPDAAYFQTTGALLNDAGDWISEITTIVFSLGALMFYTMLIQTRLIPRWLSIWGLVAIILHLVAGFLSIFGVISVFSTTQVVLNLPIALQEMVMAVWLIVKGFNPAAGIFESS